MARMTRLGKLATTITHSGDETIVSFHSTQVVKFTSKTITLNSGGWLTATTKVRMNQASYEFNLDYMVFAEKGIWRVSYDGKIIPFKDGMVITR